MGQAGRLIIVSNRVAKPKRRGAAAGGLAVGILGALKEAGGMWFGWSGKLTDRETRDPEISRSGNIEYATVELNERDFEHYYNGFSNRVLWPVCHYLLSFMHYESADFDGYRRVNTALARKLAALVKPDDVIWVHDYHLIPLAAELRAAGIDNPIGFFLHVPFPSYEAFRAVPNHEYLLRSLCAYDVVGFHTQRDLACFQQAVTQPNIGGTLLPSGDIEIGGGRLRADVFPIGIDVDELQDLSLAAQSLGQVRNLVRSLAGRDLMIGVDRLDYSKALTQRLLSYERLLEKYPNTQSNLTYLQIAPPTRSGVRAYEEIRAELEQTSGRINGRFAEADWVPIRYLNKGVDRKRLMGYFRNAAIGLVTPIRDGMNLVAKEYLAAQDPEDPGVLVLSTLAGAAQELTEAVLINPYDRDAVADGIGAALNMSLEERCERHQVMLETLRRNDIVAWRSRFVEALHGRSR
ncbi:MAG: alpha,alpha-trehalose-phosphate synthase (UDP-forming) [Pseudomonadota bacterium]